MRRPYSILLPVGFAVPLLLPATRCALTAPFRPGLAETRWFVFCGTFPQVTLAGDYPAPFLAGARTFLPQTVTRLAAVARPSGRIALADVSSLVQGRFIASDAEYGAYLHHAGAPICKFLSLAFFGIYRI